MKNFWMWENTQCILNVLSETKMTSFYVQCFIPTLWDIFTETRRGKYNKMLTRGISEMGVTFYFILPKFFPVFEVAYNWHVLITFMILKTTESYKEEKNTEKSAKKMVISWLLIPMNHLAHWITKWRLNHFLADLFFLRF